MWEFVLSMLRGTALWPTAVSLVVALAIHAVPVRFASGGVAVACGFFAGWASQDWGRLQPERYLDWSPYIALLLAAVACITLMTSRHGLRWCLWLAACGIAAWLLVPDFPRLFPPRTVSVALVAALGGLTAGVVATFEDRLPRRACTSAHLMTGSAAALILAQSYGLKFSQMAGMLTAALAGPFLLASPGGKRHTSIVFLPLLAAILFMGYANSSSDVPVFCYFLPVTAAIPLLLQRQPSSADSRPGKESAEDRADDQHPERPSAQTPAAVASVIEPQPSRARRITSWCFVALILALAVVPAILAHPPWEEELG